MDIQLDRRDFVKAAIASGAGVAAVAGADLMPAVALAQEAPAAEAGLAGTIDCDMVVAGGGAAGLATALRAKEAGIERVVVLEKRGTYGGTAYVAGGVFAAESVLQKEQGITVTKDEIFRKCVAYHNWANNARILRRYVDNADTMIDWLLAEGVEFDDVEQTGISEQTWHIPMGRMGGLLDTVYARAVEEGVEFVFDTSAKELLMADGKVAGVIAEGPEGSVQYNAPVVALCTGGYSNNPELFAEFTGWDPERWNPLGFAGRDGDGIKMGLSAGADLHIPGAVMVCGYTVPGFDSFGDPIAITAAWQPSVWVDENAMRFADESITGNFAAAGAASATVNDVYSVFDQGYFDMLVEEGLIVGPNNIYAPGTKLEGLFEQFDEVAAAGDENLFKADTLAELAEQMGVDPEALEATIAEYNGYQAAGGDPIFGKVAEYCRPLVEPPFYAFKMCRTYFTTVGGLKVDDRCRVIDGMGKPIPGLYAGGSDNGGLYGYQYDVLVAAGSQCGWCMVGGGFIAEDAMEYLGA